MNPVDFLGEMKKESSGSREKDRKEEKKSEGIEILFFISPLIVPLSLYFEPCHEKTCLWGLDEVRLKLACSARVLKV